MTRFYCGFNAKLWSQCLLLITLWVLWICPWSQDEIGLIVCLSADYRKALLTRNVCFCVCAICHEWDLWQQVVVFTLIRTAQQRPRTNANVDVKASSRSTSTSAFAFSKIMEAIVTKGKCKKMGSVNV